MPVDTHKPSEMAFVGPLQPPVHGLSSVHAAMIACAISANIEVQKFDTAARGLRVAFREVYRFILWLLRTRGKPVYVSVSGGPRQLLEFIYIALANCFSRKTYLHHHSFAYIDASPWHSLPLFCISKKSLHIVLCSCMGALLADRHRLSLSRVFALSNVVFVPERDSPPVPVERDGLATVGFISNITRDKGIFVFLEMVTALHSEGRLSGALVAGPVDPGLEQDFSIALSSRPYVKYLGPLYGEGKDEFFSKINLLVFPTMYRNEAEPLVLLEAASHGVASIAFDRGCIGQMLNSEVIDVVRNAPELIEHVRAYCKYLHESASDWGMIRHKVRADFIKSKSQWNEKLFAFLQQISRES